MSKAMFVFCAGQAVYVIVILILLMTVVRNGQIVPAALLTLCASTIPMAVITLTMERPRTLAQVFDLKVGSWAFILGDAIALPLCMAFAAYAWRFIGTSSVAWYNRPWWFGLSVIIGVLCGIGFRFMDAVGYHKAGAGGALVVPSKIYHDFGAYVILSAGLIAVALPVMVVGIQRIFAGNASTGLVVAAIAVALCFFGGWGGAVVRDMKAGLDVRKLHPVVYNWETRTATYV